MVKVRLFRTGAKKRPTYRIVAIDSRKQRQGRVLEFLGTYDPASQAPIDVRREALDRWVEKGAQLSDTVRTLLRRAERAGEGAETATAGS